MIGVVQSASLVGARGQPVTVEVHVSPGIPGLTVVGLPDTAVRESRDRVRAAVLSAGVRWPQRRVTVNLAPSATPKGGAGLDLPIAVGVLVASGDLPAPAVAGLAFVGELGLDGTVRHVPGMVALADAAEGAWLVVPAADVTEAAFARPGAVRCVSTLRELIDAVTGLHPWSEPPGSPDGGGADPLVGDLGDLPAAPDGLGPAVPDLADVRGQRLGRRAVEVAAAGAHHVLLVGPPGAGKTMLAERLPGLLPPLQRSEALEVCRTRSCAGLPLPERGAMRRPPFRAPHHGASAVALVGGGTVMMRPGEISLATHGVLFLDEMGEFPASVLDALRQPLEDGVVRISRARGSVTLPARFLLVGAMNPCPCGRAGPEGHCQCTQAARMRYVRRLSGPLLDRFDLVVALSRADPQDLVQGPPGEPSAVVAARVEAVRRCAERRGVEANARLRPEALVAHCPLEPDAAALLEEAVQAGRLSARGMHRVHRVARTLADLEGADPISREHVAEALVLRDGQAVLRPAEAV